MTNRYQELVQKALLREKKNDENKNTGKTDTKCAQEMVIAMLLYVVASLEPK